MKIFFLMRHSGYIRNYESALKLLSERGHRVHLAFLKLNTMFDEKNIRKLLAGAPNIDYAVYLRKNNAWAPLSEVLRKLQDYLRYLLPHYKKTHKLRERAALRIPKAIIVFLRIIFENKENRIWSFIGFLRKLEQTVPDDKRITKMLSSFEPDIFLITPLVDFGASQLDWLKCAKSLGIKTCLCVASWDNLTNKGLVQIEPSRIIVWNHFQVEELVHLHKISPFKIIITGAQCYDQWFEKIPSLSKEQFCHRAGLDPHKPFILYLCSSPFISPQEAEFVKKWLKNIKTHKKFKLEDLGILVRPHPQNAEHWQGVDLSCFENISIFPKQGANPIDDESRDDFFHSIYYAEAIVGVNTSAFIEAGVLGKPIFTILTEDFKDTQEGTLHFRYLSEGGLLYVARDFEEHLLQLKNTLDRKGAHKERIRDFIKNFVRPGGLQQPATSIFVDALEDLTKVPSDQSWYVSNRNYFVKMILFPFSCILFLFNGFSRRVNNILVKNKKIHKNKKQLPLFLRTIKPLFLPIAQRIKKNSYVKNYIIPWLIKEEIGGVPYSSEIIKIEKEISLIASGNAPIVIGPWLSEIGFEILYWIPFLKWFTDEYRIKKERVYIVSRGGAALWYKGISEKYIDVFDYFTPVDLKREHEIRIANTGGQKHITISSFDKDLVKRASDDFGINDYNWLHPSLMYELFSFYWRRRYPISLITKHTKYERFCRSGSNQMIDLPERYIAVKFYFRPSFPDTPENRVFISHLLQGLAKNNKVVLLGSGIDIDDHHDYDKYTERNIYTFKNIMNPRNNIDIQTKIISNAVLFIGTYGGFSYLAPFYDVPSIAFYSREDKFLPVHLDVVSRVRRFLKSGEFEKLKKNDIDISSIPSKADFLAIDVHSFTLMQLLLMGESLLEKGIKTHQAAKL